MLKLYAMFLSLIFLIELIAAIVGLVFRHEIRSTFENGYMDALKKYNSTGDDQSRAVDTIQRTLMCCGVKTYTDWGQTAYYKTSGIPQSCCKVQVNCTEEMLKDLVKAKDVVYNDGCMSFVTIIMESRMGVVAGISFGIACFQLIGMFLACCLSRYITNNQYEMV
ncbi:PREDICTED: tetraspanin-6 [Nanorana parkeri]|uniref:tetraspanin-6 n=1 Tax=Nanorana parkeri TaxID=125878 RepID=UPI000854CF08|nr:PREDICTED: tetraspanin-6 [Nanorana parkeri]